MLSLQQRIELANQDIEVGWLPQKICLVGGEGVDHQDLLLSIAFQRGPKAEVSLVDIMRRRLTLTGSFLRPRDLNFKTMVRDEILETVWPYVEGNRLKPAMDRSFPLEEAAAAHALMESGDHVGKIVLVTGS